MKQIKRLFIPLTVIGLFLLNSCLSSSVSDYSDDAQVLKFSISNDSVPAQAQALFTIDQANGLIYNADSLPYKTKLYKRYKAVPSITTYSTAAMYFNDTTYVSGDSIDFRRKQVFKNYAANGVVNLSYNVQVRVHQVQPDSIAWVQRTYPSYSYSTTDQKAVYCNSQVMLFVNDGSTVHLFSTPDAKSWTSDVATQIPATLPLQNMVVLNDTAAYMVQDGQNILHSRDGVKWTPQTVTSAYQLKSLITTFNGLLLAVTNDSNGKYYVSSSPDGVNWTPIYTVPTDFPISDYAATDFFPPTGTEKILIVGGKNAAGSVVNSTYSYMGNNYNWVNCATEMTPVSFKPRQDAAVLWYDDEALLLGGTLAGGGLVTDTITRSATEGYLWVTKDTLITFPHKLNYPLRTKTSFIMDQYNRLFVIGGKDANGNFLKDAWVGRKNKMGWGMPPM